MKIGFLTGHAPSVYLFRLDCMKYLQANGFEVAVLAPEPPEEWEQAFEQHRITYTQVALSKNSTNPFSDISAYFDIKKKLKAIRPDIVFCDHAKMIIYGLLAAKRLKIKNSLVMMGGVGSVLRDPPEGLKRKLVKLLLTIEYRFSLPLADRIFFQNEDDFQLFESYRMAKRSQAVMVPGSGINLERFPYTPMPENHDFLFVGRLIRDKGLMEYMQAGRLLRESVPDAKLHVIGYFDANQTMLSISDLQPYIDDGTVIFHGKQDNVLPYLQQCFSFVLPSYHEGTPRSVLEALSVGRPIITTDAPGCRETVINDKNGFLVPIKDAQALADAMLQLCRHPKLSQEMAKASRAYAESRFDVNIVCEITQKTISEIVER